VFAGAGVQPGIVHGASDRYAAQPHSNPVTPEDIAATIYEALGLDPESRIVDAENRPHHLALGQPIRGILR
jgi:arylsulfatase A-like enzyme